MDTIQVTFNGSVVYAGTLANATKVAKALDIAWAWACETDTPMAIDSVIFNALV